VAPGLCLDDLEWDVKVYLVVNARRCTKAGCAAWGTQTVLRWLAPDDGDSATWRFMGNRAIPLKPLITPMVCRLITNLIELVTSNTVASAPPRGLTPGKIAILSWPGNRPQSCYDLPGSKMDAR